MSMRYVRTVIAAAAILVLSLAPTLFSCSETTDPDDNDTSGCEDIEAMVSDARSALADKLYEHMQDGAEDPEAPDDVDFTGVLQLFQEAYNCESSHLEARMGLAVTSLLAMSMDPEVNAAFDEWEAYLEDNTPFETGSPKGHALGIPLTFASGSDALALPFDLITHSVALTVSPKALEASPSISRVQTILTNRVMPKLVSAIAYLAPVVDDDDYTFIVTPRMQGDGDPNGDSEEIDHTDILVLRAACQLLMAGCNIATAYDLSFASYDEAGLLAAFDQADGTILALTSGGEGRMQAVPELCKASIDDLSAAITSLLAETDDQDDDVIKIGPDDLSQQDVIDMRDDYLPDIRSGFEGPVTRTEDWDDDEYTPETPLTVNLAAFFDDPIEDFKAMAPPYVLTTEQRTWDDGWAYEGGNVDTAPIDIPTDGYYNAWVEVNYDNFVQQYYNSSGDPLIMAAMDDLVAEKIAELQAMPDWGGSCWGYFDFYGQLSAGTQTISVYSSWSYETVGTWVAVPVMTWADDNYEDWTAAFPDQTLHGLLPDVTDIGDVLEQFGFDGSDWNQVTTVDWTDLD